MGVVKLPGLGCLAWADWLGRRSDRHNTPHLQAEKPTTWNPAVGFVLAGRKQVLLIGGTALQSRTLVLVAPSLRVLTVAVDGRPGAGSLAQFRPVQILVVDLAAVMHRHQAPLHVVELGSGD